MSTSDRAVGSFRFRVGAFLTLKYAVAAATVFAFVWGSVTLTGRAAGIAGPQFLWGLLGLVLVPVVAVVLAVRRLPSPSSVRALLDSTGRCGGLMMAGEACELGEWSDRVPEATPPAISWKVGRPAGVLALACGFAVLAFLVPASALIGSERRLPVEREVERLAKQIEVLKEESALDKPRAEALSKKLEQVRDESNAEDPVKTLEALDHVSDTAQQAAQKSAENATKKTEQMARAETLAEGLEKGGMSLDARTLGEVMAELASMTAKSLEENDLLAAELDPKDLEALKELAKAGKLDPAALKKLAASLKHAKGAAKGRIGRLVKAGLLDPKSLKECEKCGECQSDELAKYLKECEGKCSAKDVLAKCLGLGKGGTSRGPGSSELTWDGPKSDADGAKFKEEKLPDAALEAIKDSSIQTVTKGVPQKANPDGKVGSGALDGAQAGGGSSNAGTVLPRHKPAVGRYFDRPDAKPATPAADPAK